MKRSRTFQVLFNSRGSNALGQDDDSPLFQPRDPNLRLGDLFSLTFTLVQLFRNLYYLFDAQNLFDGPIAAEWAVRLEDDTMLVREFK